MGDCVGALRGKNSPAEADLCKRWRMQLVRKAIRVGIPLGRRPRLLVPKPLRFMRGGVERLLSFKSERALREGTKKLFSGAKS